MKRTREQLITDIEYWTERAEYCTEESERLTKKAEKARKELDGEENEKN